MAKKPPKDTAAVYALVHDVSKDVYLGSSGDVAKRLNKHIQQLRAGVHANRNLQQRYNEDPKLNVVVLVVPTKEDALDVEQFFLNAQHGNEHLLNIATDARSAGAGRPKTDAEKQRISEIHTGKVVSDLTRQRLAEANTGKSHSEETKEKLRQANLGKSPSIETREKLRITSTGRVKSPETCARISASKAGKGFPQEALDASLAVRSRKVICNGVEYASLTDAGRSLGVTDVTIRNWANSDKHPEVQFKEE